MVLGNVSGAYGRELDDVDNKDNYRPFDDKEKAALESKTFRFLLEFHFDIRLFQYFRF